MKQFETREELLQDAINYFWGKPERWCVKDGNTNLCQYIPNATSEGCAIGRLLPIEVTQSLPNKSVQEVFNELPEWMQKLGANFLGLVQECHDFQVFATKDEDQVFNRLSGYVDMTKIVFPSNN